MRDSEIVCVSEREGGRDRERERGRRRRENVGMSNRVKVKQILFQTWRKFFPLSHFLPLSPSFFFSPQPSFILHPFLIRPYWERQDEDVSWSVQAPLQPLQLSSRSICFLAPTWICSNCPPVLFLLSRFSSLKWHSYSETNQTNFNRLKLT